VETVTVEISWKAVALLVTVALTWSGGLIALTQWLFSRAIRNYQDAYRAYIDTKFEGIQKISESNETHWRKIETDIMNIRVELPEKYVQRDSWIKDVSLLHGKIDGLANLIIKRQEVADNGRS